MLILTILAPGEETKRSPDEQRAEELQKRFEKALETLQKEPEGTRSTHAIHDEIVRKIFESLDETEIILIAKYVHDIDIEDEAFRRWARFDHTGALKTIRALEDANAAEIRLSGTGPEGGPGEAVQGYVFALYLAALDGWSEVAPKAAWESFKKREGPLANSLVIEDYSSHCYQILFDHLAKVDPDLAFKELTIYCATNYDEFYISRMVAGYLHGVPRGRDWHKEVNQLLKRKWNRGWLYAEIKTALMARWLEDDPEAAEKWFKEGDIEGLHWSYIEPPYDGGDPFATGATPHEQKQIVKEKRSNGLGGAAGYWAVRDFPAAWQWMKSYRGFRQEEFSQNVIRGANTCLSNRTSYFQIDMRAREYILAQATRLPDQSDRAELAFQFAQMLWVFDDTEFLGEPPPDKAKWLKSVRKDILALRINTEKASAIIAKLQNKGSSEPDVEQPTDSKEEGKPHKEE